MRSSRQGAIPSELGNLIDELDDIQRRLRTLEAPSGESLGNTVAKLSALVADIQAELDAWAATRWTNDQINARILSLIASHMAGNVSIGGALNVLGTLDVAGEVTMPNVFATNIVPLGGTRYAAWVRDGGRLGHT
ncbi:hypothetical protein [Microbacterium sp. PAMC21962]|uniref:hypothetical protein n=1 Tax=Microbacterium sp. PAMC21962 TaxID=2861280 RepID=UPI001C62DFD2|nr:hypothetical protein [Microbacterium sp. PAMC21962]QYF98272.1 hypothetical protein KY498_03230 [Microbacterium sp. PAMC21962]